MGAQGLGSARHGAMISAAEIADDATIGRTIRFMSGSTPIVEVLRQREERVP